MAGRRRLSGGKPRLLGNHHGTPGLWYSECWAALSELAPLTGLLRLEAGRVCVAWVQFRAATEALQLARRVRKDGKGRRPGGRDIERLARRQGLADGSYSQALDRFRGLVGSHPARSSASPMELMRQWQSEQAEGDEPEPPRGQSPDLISHPPSTREGPSPRLGNPMDPDASEEGEPDA